MKAFLSVLEQWQKQGKTSKAVSFHAVHEYATANNVDHGFPNTNRNNLGPVVQLVVKF